MRSDIVVMVLGISAFALGSCKKEDPEVLAEIEALNKQIAEKEAELALLREDINERKIDDPSDRLAEVQLKLDDVKAEADLAKQEVKLAKQEKEQVIADFKAYQKKYPIRDK